MILMRIAFLVSLLFVSHGERAEIHAIDFGADLEGVETKRNLELETSLLEHFSMSKAPTLIISAGPTGSGKTSQQALIKFEKFKNSAWSKILIDDYVENDAFYKTQVFRFLVSRLILTRTDLDASLRAGLGDALANDKIVSIPRNLIPDDATLNSFAKNLSPRDSKLIETLYYNTRNKVGCGGRGCGPASDKDFFEACANGVPVVNEVTGKDYPSWFIKECGDRTPGGTDKLKVWVAGNLVTYCSGKAMGLEERNSGRAAGTINHFLNDPVGASAPRFPDLNDLPEFVDKYVDEMIDIIGCLQGDTFNNPAEWKKDCAGRIDKVMLFNNDLRPIKKAFELTKDSPETLFEQAKRALLATKPPVSGCQSGVSEPEGVSE